MSILARLTILVLLALAPTIAAHGVNDILLYHEREQELRDAALATAVIRNAELDGVVRGVQHLLGPVSRLRAVTSLDAHLCGGALSTLVQDFPHEDLVLAAMDLTGNVFCASTSSNFASINLSDNALFRSTIRNRQFTVGEYVLTPVTSGKAIAFGQPIFNENGEVAGAVVAYIDLDWLASDLERAPLPAGQILIVTDRDGVVLVRLPRGPEGSVGRKLLDRQLAMIREAGPGIIELNDRSGHSTIYGFIPITVPPPDIYVLFGLDKKTALGPIYEAAWRSVALGALSILAALLIAWAMGERSIRRPMRRLLETVRLWRDGEYSARANVEGGASEIGEFSTAFNSMAESIQLRDQQLAAANRAKDIIIATAGHDLRQPLQSITAALSVFSRRPLSEREHRYLDGADQAIDRLVQDLDTLVETTRVHYGALRPQLEPIAMDWLLQEIMQQWSTRAREKGLRLRVRPCTVMVVSDAKMILTILHNLVGNAVKYTDHGGILVGCRRRADEVWIEVHDSGSGIPADKIETIFGEFQQLHSVKEGFGLGLWIARSTADALGYKVSVRSIVGRGSRFRIIIPASALVGAMTSAG